MVFTKQPRKTNALVPTIFSSVQSSRSRIQNLSAIGYLVYIGVNAPPDLSAPPYSVQTGLPITLPYTPGSNTLYVVVRSRNSYGLISNNQQPTIIPTPTLPPLTMTATVSDTALLVKITYVQADRVKVWVKATPPDIGVDTPAYDQLASQAFSFGTFTPGTYFVVVGLFSGSSLSSTLMTTVTFPTLPTSLTFL